MTHLLDTDTCIGVLRQRPGMVQRLSQVAPTDCAVSMVTIGSGHISTFYN